jgi:ribonuclease P protein component
MRTGIRTAAPEFSVFVSKEATPEIRFGFIISKAVGNAVTRNRIKRQLRAIAAGAMNTLPKRDIVIRVNPRAANSRFDDLVNAFENSLVAVRG